MKTYNRLSLEEAWAIIREHKQPNEPLKPRYHEAMRVITNEVDRLGKWASEPFIEWSITGMGCCMDLLDNLFNYQGKEDQ